MAERSDVSDVLLDVSGLGIEFTTAGGPLRAVEDVSFQVRRGSTLSIVGESGSGKSVTALSIPGLLDRRVARVSGSIAFAGENIASASASRLRELRGAHIGMIFQDPTASLDPSWRVGRQIAEAILVHEKASRAEGPRGAAAARTRAIELLREVGIPAPEERVDAYPHQLSGGMRQRVMIAIALACRPELLIADEPTTALDVTIQAQIVDLLRRLQAQRKMSILLITHDIGLVAESSDDVVVLYAGRVVERGPARQVLESPRHPYTAGLLASTPVPGRGEERLVEIAGIVPDLRSLPPGCRFQDRCAFRQDLCATEPSLVVHGERAHRCHFPLDGASVAGAGGTR